MMDEASNAQPEQQEADKTDPISAAIRQASDLSRQGDFRSARNAIDRARGNQPASDGARLDALERSFRLDPAVGLVVALTSAGLALIAAMTLFR